MPEPSGPRAAMASRVLINSSRLTGGTSASVNVRVIDPDLYTTLTFKAADGKTELHGILQKPSNFDPAKKYPVVFLIHGKRSALGLAALLGEEIHGILHTDVEALAALWGMYVCGVTVYDRCHIGHARSLVFFDTAVRYLRFAGYEVKFVRNITDDQSAVGGIDFNNPTGFVNEPRIWGVEVDSSFKLGPNFKLDVGYTYLNTRVLEAQLPTIPPYYNPALTFLQAAKGDKLALSPTNTVVITGTYTLPLADRIGKISLGATFNHTDAFLAEALAASPAALIAAENQLNLNVDWRKIFGNPIDLSFYMTNVTNQGRILFPSSSYTLFGMDGGHVNQPRMWGFRLKYSFGN